ncbi:MAG: hypothetical protein ACT4NX_09285 [Deltaproteobacteria bacterium]
MAFFFRIFADGDEIYSGDFAEVPDKFRAGIIEAVCDWADSLDRKGLNQLVYSLFAWYEKRAGYCDGCGRWAGGEGGGGNCPDCGATMQMRYVYERHKKLDMIITCAVGMISRIEVSAAGERG